jgi:hypothetical protein
MERDGLLALVARIAERAQALDGPKLAELLAREVTGCSWDGEHWGKVAIAVLERLERDGVLARDDQGWWRPVAWFEHLRH